MWSFQCTVIAALFFIISFSFFSPPPLRHTQLFQSVLHVFQCVLALAFLDATCPLGIQFPHFYSYIKNNGE